MKRIDLGKINTAVGGMMAYGLVLLVFLVISGCGSDSKQSTQQVPDKAKPVIDQKRAAPK